MAFKDIELYNKKNSTKVNVDYFKEYHTFLAKILKHEDKIYELGLISSETKKEELYIDNKPIIFNINDIDIERVDMLPNSADIYKFYLVSDAAHDRRFWMEKLGAHMPGACLLTQRLDYDLQYLSDEMFSYLETVMRNYEKDSRPDRVYVPFAHLASSEIFARLFGRAAAAFLGQNPFMNVFVAMWLHGYLLSSAIKKQGVKLVLNEQKVPLEEIERKEKEMQESMDEIIEHFRKQSEGGWKPEEHSEEGDDNDGPTDEGD